MLRRDPDLPILRFDHLAALEGLIWKSEGARLAHLAAQVPAGQCIVEIGSYKGKSTAFLAAGAKAGSKPLVHAVDLWDLGGQNSPGTARWGFDDPDTYATFEAQLRDVKMWGQVRPHRGDSIDVAADWAGPPVGLLHIDGWHDADRITREVDAWTPHLAPGAVVAFHDYGDDRYTVTEAVDAWLAATGYPADRYKRLAAVHTP